MKNVPTFQAKDGRELELIFIHSEIDDFGLTPYQFRLYAHFVRRCRGAGKAYPKVDTISEICRVCPNVVRETVKELEGMGLIEVQRSKNTPSVIILLPKERWKINPRPSPDGGHPSPDEGHLYSKGDTSKESTHQFLPFPEASSPKAEENPILKRWAEKGFPKIIKWTADREKAFRARWKEKDFRENWSKALDKMGESNFWTKTKKPDLDWFLKPDKWALLVEGRYDSYDAPKANSVRNLATLKLQVETHPANYEFIRHNPNCTPEQKTEYKALKAKLRDAERQP